MNHSKIANILGYNGNANQFSAVLQKTETSRIWKVRYPKGTIAFKIFNKRFKEDRVSAACMCQDFMAQKGFAPIINRLNGNLYGRIGGDFYCVSEWVQQKNVNINNIGTVSKIGRFIGEMHTCLSKFSIKAPNFLLMPLPSEVKEQFQMVRNDVKYRKDPFWLMTLNRKIELLKGFTNSQVKEYSHYSGAVHGDLRIDNIIFDKNSMPRWIIDWDQVSTFPLTYELLRFMLSLGELKVSNFTNLLKAFLNEYSMIRILNAWEVENMLGIYLYVQIAEYRCYEKTKYNVKHVRNFAEYRWRKIEWVLQNWKKLQETIQNSLQKERK